MKIEAAADVLCGPGDFCATVRDRRLELPGEIARRLEALSITTAEDLVSCAWTFPTSIASQLGWSVIEVERATSHLADALKGYVDEKVLHPDTPVQRRYGARDPRDLVAFRR